ncbi:Transcriptional regulator (Partial), partial [Seminavis robusta]|eukprot:Sro2420_g327150.1 Transcriptional regulator (849) ;mRNA; f:12346-14893
MKSKRNDKDGHEVEDGLSGSSVHSTKLTKRQAPISRQSLPLIHEMLSKTRKSLQLSANTASEYAVTAETAGWNRSTASSDHGGRSFGNSCNNTTSSTCTSQNGETEARRSFGLVTPEVTLVQPHAEQEKQARIDKALHSINKLQFESVGLVGRSKEIQILQHLLSLSLPTKKVLLISGASGCGKTALVNTALQEPVWAKQGVFVRGKFTNNHQRDTTSTCSTNINNHPLSGIGKACNQLCTDMVQRYQQSQPDRLCKMREQLEAQIDAPLLCLLETTILPNLVHILEFSLPSTSSSDCQQDRPNDKTPEDHGTTTRRARRPSLRRRNTFNQSQLQGFIRSASRQQHPNTTNRRARRPSMGFPESISSYESSLTSGGVDPVTISAKRRLAATVDPRHSKLLLQYAIRAFLRIMAADLGDGSPLVFVMDDLQWSDMPSMDMFQAIATDPEMPHNLILVGCFRSNIISSSSQDDGTDKKKDDNHLDADNSNVDTTAEEPQTQSPPLVRAIQQLTEDSQKDDASFHLTQIALGNLSLESVQQLIEELLSVPPSRALELAQICYKRTLGNAFFVKVFLKMLHEINILQFDLGSFSWTWHDKAVERESAATDNVVSLIQTKLKRDEGQRGPMSLLLQVASLLGSSFDRRAILIIWEGLQKAAAQHHDPSTNNEGNVYKHIPKYRDCLLLPANNTDDTVDALLEQAVIEMMIEKVGDQNAATSSNDAGGGDVYYRFGHDSIQEACLSRVPLAELDEFRSIMGHCLHQNLLPDELEQWLFVVVDLLNNNDSGNCSVDVAALNARAAEKAKELAAFRCAVRYVEYGIRNMNASADIMWSHHAELAILLHSLGAEAEEC